jgi:glycosyltransferase involved in cell wall biosynthesis
MNDTTADNGESRIRVSLVQPALPKYRLPVFRLLSQTTGIDLTVIYGEVNELQNVIPNGFRAVPSRRWDWNFLGWRLMIHPAELSSCSRRTADVVILRWSPRSLLVWLAAIKAKLFGIPLVLWGHGYSKKERAYWGWMRNLQARLATALVFYDAVTRDAYLAKGFSAESMFVAANTIGCEEIEAARSWWDEAPERLAEFRREHDLDNGPMILFVSRLAPANRVDLLIAATALLTPEFPTLKTVVIGNGAAEKSRLEQLAKSLNIEQYVRFCEGIYEERKIAPWFLTATVFCYPENVGLSLLHSFAYSVPVVTSDNRRIQNPEVAALQPGVNGDVYKHQDVSSLAMRLREILTDDAKQKSMSTAARETIATRFTLPNMVEGLSRAIRFAANAEHAQD